MNKEFATYAKLALIVGALVVGVVLVKRPEIFSSKAHGNSTSVVSPTPRLEVSREVPKISTKEDVQKTITDLDALDPDSVRTLLK